MADQPKQTLLDDLEAIRNSLDTIESNEPYIPTLEEIVGHRAPTTVNPSNPFLSSTSLSELIKIRNEAEARAAEELAKVERVKPVEEILAAKTKEDTAPEEPVVFAPDPNVIIAKMEQLFESWIDNSVSLYVEVFEAEIRNRLTHDFKELVVQWYLENELPVPEHFKQSPSEQDDTETLDPR